MLSRAAYGPVASPLMGSYVGLKSFIIDAFIVVLGNYSFVPGFSVDPKS